VDSEAGVACESKACQSKPHQPNESEGVPGCCAFEALVMLQLGPLKPLNLRYESFPVYIVKVEPQSTKPAANLEALNHVFLLTAF
jgi:hypothetical protein